jgi:hypothetical protein
MSRELGLVARFADRIKSIDILPARFTNNSLFLLIKFQDLCCNCRHWCVRKKGAAGEPAPKQVATNYLRGDWDRPKLHDKRALGDICDGFYGEVAR